MDFVDRLLVKERKSRMTASEALQHPWLKQRIDRVSTKVIRTLKHRRYYHTLIKKDLNMVVSAARISCGGAIRSQRGVSVAKVKVASIEIGPVSGQIMHAIGEEGGYVKYVCKIENYDQSTQVTWYFGVRQLENSEKYEITYEDGVATMYVKDITKFDDGTYRCKVVNDYGEDSSYAELFVKGVREVYDYYCRRTKKVKRRTDAMRLLERPPEFTLPLYNKTAYVGENVRFGVTITVHPEPRVTWYKSGQKIKPGDDEKKYTFESDKGLYQLTINSVTTDDDAEYTVVARNKHGEDSCKAKLTVTLHPPPTETTLRPMFKRLLANAECHEGQSVCFEIRVSGIPAPTLKWEKDGQPLSLGPHIEIVHEGLDYYALHIRDTLPEDTGYYRVTATNTAGSTSCQAHLQVERLRYVKQEFQSKEERERHVQKQIDKTLRMAEILSGTETVPLTPVAQEALREAAILYKPAVSTKTVKGEYRLQTEEKKEERKLRMPYEVPEPRRFKQATVEEDQRIKQFVPMSDMKWYKKIRDQYEMPGKLDRVVQKRPKRIRLSRWEQFYVMPLPRITDQYRPKWRIPKLTQDDLEMVRPARRRTPSPDYDLYYYRRRRRSLGDMSDEELLLPIDDYLAMKRTEEERLRLEEELELGFSASPPSRSPPRFELSSLRYSSPPAHVKVEDRRRDFRYSTYHVPTKEETSTSYAELRERHAQASYRQPKLRQRIMAEKEEEELLRPVTTTQRLSEYKSELDYMSKEEKSKKKSKRQRQVTEITEIEEEYEISRRAQRESSSSVSRLLRRRRSLSPTYIELMRPVSELIRSHPRPAEEYEDDAERRSPTPERTRPRSPSPVSSERSLSRFERSARFDIFSRYESMKAALKTQKTSERKYEVLSQQPFTLDHAPRITLRMRSHRVPCGQNTRFILNVQSKPTAEVKWYHNGVELQESSKIHYTNTSGVLTLEILDCQTEDGGTYRAVCTNYKGEASDYATLDVTGGAYTTYASQRRDEEVPKSVFPELTKTEAYAVSSFKRTSELEAASSVREVKSQMTETRESLSTYEHYASAEMKSATSEEKSLEEKATVRKIKTTLAARILTKPRSITVHEGESARFSCDTDGEPVPTVTWLREGQVVSTSARHQVTTTKYKSTFEISSVQASDEGNYSVVVENSDGKQEAQFTLTVQKARVIEKAVTSPPRVKSPEPRVKSPETVKSPKRVKSPEPVTSHPKAVSPTETKPTEKGQHLPVSAPPKITQSLKAEASKDIAKLTCAVESSALCAKEVAWYKDGKKLKENGHFQFHYSADGTYELKIHNLSESDCGEYVCEVSGEGGTSKTSFQFTGQSFKSIHEQVSSISETTKSVQKTAESAEAKKSAQKTAESVEDKKAAQKTVESAEAKKPAQKTAESPEAKKPAQKTAESPEAKKQEPIAPESISSKPVIVTGLRDTTVSSDSVAKFTIKVTGEPQPTITWTKDGKAIAQGSKYKLSSNKEEFILEILKTETSDGGLYACTVTNSAGSVSSSCKLTIKAVKDTEAQKVSTQKTSEVTSQKKASAQEEISQKALTSEEIKMSEVKSHETLAIKEEASKVLIAEEVKRSAAASLEKSIVHEEVTKTSQASEEVKTHAEIKTLSTQMNITKGQRATLKANIAGATDVKWVLNGTELPNSEEYRYGVSGSDQTLTIKQASHREEGILSCIGKTSQGVVKCQFDLTLSEELSDAPSFITQPRSQNINEGQNVLFSCEVSGEPSPEIEWFKNNLPISISSNISVSRSRNVYTLEIRNAAVSDSGKYTIKAKNFHGQCSATASLTVLPLVEEPPREVVLKTSSDVSLHGSVSSQSVQMSASKQEASFSSFSSSSASSMTEMKFASMSAQSMSSMQESFVEMSSSSFMGKSSMTQLESSTSRMLKAGGRGIPPKIEALPSDISIDEGKVLTVACAFTGEPTPEITWSCGGRKIQNQEQQGRFHIENTDDLTTLIIMDVQKQDGGLYTLSLGNEFGSDSATVNINIRSM